MSANPFITGAKVLGFYGLVATWRRNAPDTPTIARRQPGLIISSAATTEEGVHEPAQSISLHTRESLLALREAIDEALREDAQQ
ncbi:hypothetical protein SAMN05216359_105331 [Roseateles sp. YR242]|uniref:hypothetical protein n=1 Tax=Roseateles sp. YR242 TaxID=1855305 RepID=UPI0008C60AC9|nr:hypothetical protein [Roseateles sp. YR242]SEL13654.1 hypothetical protein SAMN05216359_105331 [Roseateles sp. YR242]